MILQHVMIMVLQAVLIFRDPILIWSRIKTLKKGGEENTFHGPISSCGVYSSCEPLLTKFGRVDACGPRSKNKAKFPTRNHPHIGLYQDSHDDNFLTEQDRFLKMTKRMTMTKRCDDVDDLALIAVSVSNNDNFSDF